MITLFVSSFFFIISVILSVIFFIIGLFTGNIILFDSIAIAVVSGISLYNYFAVHPALCLVAGILIFFLLFWVQNTSVGFWIISLLMSIGWGGVFGSIAYLFSEGDFIWMYVIWGIGTIITLGLHLKARI